MGRLRELAEEGLLGALCERNGVALLVIHGSAIEPREDVPARDLDFAFLGRARAGVDIVALNNDFIDATGFDRIDLMDLGTAGPVARARALAPGTVVLYEAEPGLYAREQIRAITEEMETRPLRRLDLELMAAA